MMNKFFIICCLFTLTSLLQAAPRELIGRVSDVPNGDTIIVTDKNNKRHKVYLLGIDAPETKQRFGKQSRDYLDRLLFARNYQVKIIIKKRTRSRNIVGTVFAADMNSSQYADINGMMVMAGYAWANPRTSKQYVTIEQIARKRKAGLWQQKNPVAPWKWRRKH
jgi:endonuclease YncB( thermonuclease family)